VTLVDERGVVPIIVLDDAQALRDEVLHELHGLANDSISISFCRNYGGHRRIL